MTTTFKERRTAAQEAYDAEVLARVKRGIAWLEENAGPDWVDRLDLAELNLKDGAACVLGQVFDGRSDEGDDGYWWAVNEYPELDNDRDIDYGFCKAEGESSWDALQEAWESALIPMVRRTHLEL